MIVPITKNSPKAHAVPLPKPHVEVEQKSGSLIIRASNKPAEPKPKNPEASNQTNPTQSRSKQTKPAASKRVEPSSKTSAPRKGSKTGKILALLSRPQGATLKELRKATTWQPHSIRGFLSGVVKTKMRRKLTSIQRPDGERAYRIPAK